MYLTKRTDDFYGLPRVVLIEDDGLIVARPKPWLSNFVLVSVFVSRNNVERLVAAGFVTNVQIDGLVQMRVEAVSDEFGLDQLRELEPTQVLIKPGVSEHVRGI